MRILILTLALLSFALPAFATCGADHEASGSSSSTASNPPAAPPSGG